LWRRHELLLGTRIVKIEPAAQKVIDERGREYHYDQLLIATGAVPVAPPIEGLYNPASFAFHTQKDIDELLAYIRLQAVKDIIVIGGGLTGVEAADAFLQRGLRVTLVERSQALLSHIIDEQAAAYVLESAQKKGVNVLLDWQVARVDYSTGSVVLTNTRGQTQSAQMVVYAVGQRPNTTLGAMVGVALHNNYYLVDEYMQTSDPHIFAAGDCVTMQHKKSGTFVPTTTWSDALQQGIIAAHNMAGQVKAYRGIVPLITSAFFGNQFVVGGFASSLISQRSYEINHYEATWHNEAGRLDRFVFIGNDAERLRALRVLFMKSL
jgi:NADPH-dependent 2,4-dienoyl-CoA reductase/sulfur reductase-like enzyme